MSTQSSSKQSSSGKHARGRPTKYSPAYGAKLIAFMKRGGAIVTRPMVVSHGNGEGSAIVDHPLGRLPAFFEDFAVSIGVVHDTLLEWCKVHPEFSAAYKKAKHIQLANMLKGGLAGTYQQAALIFSLKNIHGWRDRSEIEHSGEVDVGPLVMLPATSDRLPAPTTNGNGRPHA